MDFSTDEYFGTLGGSLMKDLLADLQVEDGDFSLEHLERELAQLDNNEPSQVQPPANVPLNAASLVVSHAQEQQGGLGNSIPATAPAAPGMDAWSLSLQNFTSLSLQDDFLAADSARKQQQQQATDNIRRIPGLDAALDYDIGERPAIVPPPGLGGAPPGTGAGASANPRQFPRTPQNSLAIQEEDAAPIRNDIMQSLTEEFKSMKGDPEPAPMPPLNAIPNQTASGTTGGPGIAPPTEMIPPQGPPSALPGPPEGVVPPQGAAARGPDYLPPLAGPMPPQSQPKHTPTGPPLSGAYSMQPPIVPGIPPGGMPPTGMPPRGMPPTGMPGAPPPVLLAVPAEGPAWQRGPPPAPMPKPPPIFCNPHPAAPPIPGTVVESKFMSARDVTYIVHSILKPVLAEGVSDDDYHIQYFLRMGDPQANTRKTKHGKDMNKEMTSRENRSKEWSSEKGTLGYVAKSNVARPRALIATPQPTTEQDSEHKQRASLWKARLCCDQAYQSFDRVVAILRKSPPGNIPPEVQKHVAKLMKCMGITMVDKEYQMEPETLKLLLKLSKGQSLIARTLDLTLLPPNAVLVLLPTLTEIMFVTAKNEDPASNRLFRSLSNVVQRIAMSFDKLLNCLDIVVQKGGKTILSSEAKMAYAHILLRKGAFELNQNPTPENKAAWGKAESEFAALLGAI